jgi:hypothetical protein
MSMDEQEKKTMFSRILHKIEREVVEHAINFLTAKGYIIGSVIHDGFLIKKNSGPKPSLTKINKYVHNQNGLGLEFDWEDFE